MKKKYMAHYTQVIVVDQPCALLAGFGEATTNRYATVGADGNAFKDDHNNGEISIVGDVYDRGPSSSAKRNGFTDSFE